MAPKPKDKKAEKKGPEKKGQEKKKKDNNDKKKAVAAGKKEKDNKGEVKQAKPKGFIVQVPSIREQCHALASVATQALAVRIRDCAIVLRHRVLLPAAYIWPQ